MLNRIGAASLVLRSVWVVDPGSPGSLDLRIYFDFTDLSTYQIAAHLLRCHANSLAISSSQSPSAFASGAFAPGAAAGGGKVLA
jgi:hypothetical protein